MKTYIDKGVQAGVSQLHSRALSLDAGSLAPSPNDPPLAIGDSQLLSPLAPSLQVSPAYSHSPARGSSLSKTELSSSSKPRQLPLLKPSAHRHSSIRVFSLPEDSPAITGRETFDLVPRVVSMPEQRPNGAQLADSSLSTEGYDGSMLSGGSFLSGTDTTSGICFSSHTQGTIPHTPSPPPSPDSVLIIENNCGLSEAFLSNQHPTKASSPGSEMKMPNDEGWITWAKSPPRPIPALHGPLSLPYARCPSGAEGTIIEEPDNLPRVIWGLDSGEHRDHSDDFGPDTKVKKLSTQPPQPFRHSPRQYKPSDENPAEFSTRTHSSVGSVSSTRAGSDTAQAGTLKPRDTSAGYTDVVYNPYSETIVLENLVERRNARAVNHGHDYDSTVDLTRTLERNLHFRESETELQNGGELDRNLLSTTYGSRNSLSSSRPSGAGLPAMRVSSRPAVGSALPQILIEPRSPEVSQATSRRMTAMELAHQYQQQQLLKMQQQSLLPTPPNSSSPLWSSEFSPYNHQSVSPVSLRHQVVQEQLQDPETSNQLRYLMRERLGRNIMHDHEIPHLVPPPQINPVPRPDYSSYELDPATSQALTNFLATQDYQHLSPLSSEVLLPVSRTTQTLPGYLGHDARRYAAPHRDALSSPSHEEFRYARGHSQHQIPRSIPLARLMQRRLSSVPEEDSSPTINGRSPSPSQLMRHGADRPYLHPPAEHGYQYADILGSSGNYPVAYLDPASHGSQSKVRGSVFNNKSSSTAGATALDIQGRYRARHEGSSSEKDPTPGPKRASGGLRKTRGRPRIHPN
ncbi:hypothetical protein EDB84DRAFT_1556949 [Lactarius hengduanensis]|nr:hypothetical protein EDB84DRAFT_1556949 [Lactarius hengduanensis]